MTDWGRYIEQATAVAAGVILGANAIRLLAEFVDSLSWNGPMSFTGGVLGVLAWRPSLWFHPIDAAPHFPTTYPPTVPAIIGGLWRLTGGTLDIFTTGRLVGLASIFAAACLIGLLIDAYTRDVYAALLGSGLYLFSPLVSVNVVWLRVDHLAIAIGLAAIYVYVTQEGRRATVLIVGLAIMAAWTKQSIITPAAAIVLADLARSRFRVGVARGLAIGGVGLSMLAVATVLTDGAAWAQLVATNGALPWTASKAVGQIVTFSRLHAATVLVGGIGVVLCLRYGDRWLVIPIFTLISLELALVIVGREGAWTGYFLPALAGLSVAAGIAFSRFRQGVHVPRMVGVAVAVILLVQVGAYMTAVPPLMYGQEAQGDITGMVAEAEGPVLSAAPGVLVTTQHEGDPYEAMIMERLAREGEWDGTDLQRSIRRQEFELIIVRSDIVDRPNDGPRWSEESARAITDEYELVYRDGGYWAYAPR